MPILKIISAVVFGYLIGSILTGEIVARLKQVNLRSQGSGNVGATNVLRSMGPWFGVLVLMGDAAKGIIAVLLGGYLGRVGGVNLAIVAGLAAITGHNWSVFAHFKGGKGIATSLGVIIGLTPLTLIILIPVFLGAVLLSRYVSLASVLAALAYPVTVFFLFPKRDPLLLVGAFLIAIAAVYRHKENLRRLWKGEEHKISFTRRKDEHKE